MQQVLAQVNFEYTCSKSEIKQMASNLKEEIAQVNGLIWKIWIHNAEDNLAGGQYLFESREAAEAYIDGPIGDEMRDHPELTNLDVTYFRIMEEPSRATDAPVFPGKEAV